MSVVTVFSCGVSIDRLTVIPSSGIQRLRDVLSLHLDRQCEVVEVNRAGERKGERLCAPPSRETERVGRYRDAVPVIQTSEQVEVRFTQQRGQPVRLCGCELCANDNSTRGTVRSPSDVTNTPS